MKAKSIKGGSAEEIQAALLQSMEDGFRPTLGFVFISIKQDREAVCELLHQQDIDVVGATSSGEFINGYQDMGSAVVLLLDLDRAFYTILFEEIGDGGLPEAATRIAQAAMQKFKRPAFILCNTGISVKGDYLDGEALVRSIEKVVGPQVNIYGGMAGDDLTITGTYVFTYERSSDAGIAALVLDEEKVSLYGMAISGWKPIGTFKTVTKSDGVWVYAIDGQPALETYLRYLGKEPLQGEDTYKLFEELGFYYPLQMERETGAPVMRTPLMFNRDTHALMCDFEVPQGSRIRFSMPPDFDIVDTVVEKAGELKRARQAEAEALLVFSCAGRLSALGPLIKAENEGLSEVWNAPMAGFFTYGEFGRAVNGKHEFHSTTCCWVALKEKGNEPQP